jgi:hypothetical protein
MVNIVPKAQIGTHEEMDGLVSLFEGDPIF